MTPRCCGDLGLSVSEKPVTRDDLRALSGKVVIAGAGLFADIPLCVMIPCPSLALAEVVAREVKALLDHVSVKVGR